MVRKTEARELRPVNPATLEPVGTVPVSAPVEVAEAVADARLAAARWAQSSFAERRALRHQLVAPFAQRHLLALAARARIADSDYDGANLSGHSDLLVAGQYRLRQQVGSTLKAPVESLTHPLTRVVLT